MRGGMKGPGSWESGQFRRRQAALPVHHTGPMASGYGLIQRQVAPGHALRVVQAAFPLLPAADLFRPRGTLATRAADLQQAVPDPGAARVTFHPPAAAMRPDPPASRPPLERPARTPPAPP